MSTDAEVIRESLSRPALFAELYDRHHAVIHRFVARRVDRDVADDLASETFLVAFEQRQRFDPRRDDALPWLYGIVTNLLPGHRRREARAWRAVQASGGESWDEIEDGPLQAELTVKRMAAAIRGMPARTATRCCCKRGATSVTTGSRRHWAFPSGPSAYDSTAHAARCAQ